MVIPYHPDVVIHRLTSNSIALVELTCPLDSTQHLEATRDWKQFKHEYLQILLELGRLDIPSIYDTDEISVLGHYLPSTLMSLHKFVNKVCQNLYVESFWIKQQDYRFQLKTQRIFLARACMERTHDELLMYI